jgi:hypothetical protein
MVGRGGEGRYRARGVASSQPRGQLKLKNIQSTLRFHFDSNCTNTATMPSFNIVVLGGKCHVPTYSSCAPLIASR